MYHIQLSVAPSSHWSAQPHRQRGALKPAHLQTAVSLCHAALECGLCEPTDHRPVGRTPRGETHALGTYSPRRHARSDPHPSPSHALRTRARCMQLRCATSSSRIAHAHMHAETRARPPTTHHCTTTSGHVTRSARDGREMGARWARDGHEMGARFAARLGGQRRAFPSIAHTFAATPPPGSSRCEGRCEARRLRSALRLYALALR